MDVGIDTEKIPLLTGVDNPGYDETGEQMEMEISIRMIHQADMVRLILQAITEHMKKLHLVENQVVLRH